MRGHDVVWVIVDWLTKSSHFMPVNLVISMAKLAQIYIKEIVRLHGLSSSIVYDQDPMFTSQFGQTLQDALGTKLRMSSTYHAQIDGQSERTIQFLEDLVMTCVMNHFGVWDEMLLLVEFAYNNSYHANIGMTLYEALYGRKCGTLFLVVSRWRDNVGRTRVASTNYLEGEIDSREDEEFPE